MKKFYLIIILLVSAFSFSQKMKINKGDFKFLSGQKDVNVEFVYTDLKLMKDNVSENQYVETRKKELNEKTRGVGDSWEKKWQGAKTSIWQPKFLELLSATITKDKDIVFKEGFTSAKYTLIVSAVWVFPGWDVYMMKQPAKVSTLLKIVETANRNNVLVEVETANAPGDQWGSNFSNESRIGEGFAKTAKSFGKLMIKGLK